MGKKRMDEELCCGKSSDSASEQMMKRIFNLYNVKIDPHTAIGLDVAYSFNRHIFGDDQDNEDEAVPMVVASTAHWSKFPQTMLKSLDDGHSLDVDCQSCSELFEILESKHRSINGIHPDIESLVFNANQTL